FLTIQCPTHRPTLFPYTTLFRSIKVHKAITTSAKGSGDVIKADELRVEAYLEQFVIVSKLLIANDESNALSRAFLIMAQLRDWRSEEHTSELQSRFDLVCRLLLE